MRKLTVAAAFVLASLGAASSARADDYDDAFAKSRGLAETGALGEAAKVLEAVLPEYPQDYAIAIELAWLYFRMERYADAERVYRLAVARSPQGIDGHLGLGWSLLRQERCNDAEKELREVLASEPGHARAKEGLAVCKNAEAPVLTVFAGYTHYAFPSHPVKSAANGLVAAASGVIADHWVLGAAYRFMAFSTVDSAVVGAFAQHDVYAQAGYATAKAGLVLQAAMVADGSQTLGTSNHVGATGRLSLAGDLVVGAWASYYDDLSIARVDTSWKLPLGSGFSVVPGFATQLAGKYIYGSGALTALYERRSGAVWVNGRYGEEVRPANLSNFVIYDVTERVTWGLGAGGRVSVTRGVGLFASYGLDRLRRTDALTPKETFLHAVTVGPSLSF